MYSTYYVMFEDIYDMIDVKYDFDVYNNNAVKIDHA